MDKEIEDSVAKFRSYLRMLRKGINDSCYFFRKQDYPLQPFQQIFPKIDDIFRQLFNANNTNPNDKIDAMELFFKEIFPLIDPTEFVTQTEPLIKEMNDKFKQKLASIDMTTLDEKKRNSYETIKKKFDLLETPFQAPEYVDIIKLTKQMANLFVPTLSIDLTDIEDLVDKYHAIFSINCSYQSLKSFEMPEHLTPERAEIKQLKKQIEEYLNTIDTQKRQISKLQQEKMQFKSANIELKKENEMLKDDIEFIKKKNHQLDQRAANTPKLKSALEEIADIVLHQD